MKTSKNLFDGFVLIFILGFVLGMLFLYSVYHV